MADYSFNMTAGTAGFGLFGYGRSGNGFTGSAFGSIDAEPISGQTLDYCASFFGRAYVTFLGDLSALLAGYEVWVDGVNYGTGIDSWSFDGTTTVWYNDAPAFSNGVTHFIELKPGAPPAGSIPPIIHHRKMQRAA